MGGGGWKEEAREKCAMFARYVSCELRSTRLRLRCSRSRCITSLSRSLCTLTLHTSPLLGLSHCTAYIKPSVAQHLFRHNDLHFLSSRVRVRARSLQTLQTELSLLILSCDLHPPCSPFLGVGIPNPAHPNLRLRSHFDTNEDTCLTTGGVVRLTNSMLRKQKKGRRAVKLPTSAAMHPVNVRRLAERACTNVRVQIRALAARTTTFARARHALTKLDKSPGQATPPLARTIGHKRLPRIQGQLSPTPSTPSTPRPAHHRWTSRCAPPRQFEA